MSIPKVFYQARLLFFRRGCSLDASRALGSLDVGGLFWKPFHYHCSVSSSRDSHQRGFGDRGTEKRSVEWKSRAEVPFSPAGRMSDNLPSVVAISSLPSRTSSLCVASWRPGMLKVILKECCSQGLPGSWLRGWAGTLTFLDPRGWAQQGA